MWKCARSGVLQEEEFHKLADSTIHHLLEKIEVVHLIYIFVLLFQYSCISYFANCYVKSWYSVKNDTTV